MAVEQGRELVGALISDIPFPSQVVPSSGENSPLHSIDGGSNTVGEMYQAGISQGGFPSARPNIDDGAVLRGIGCSFFIGRYAGRNASGYRSKCIIDKTQCGVD